MTARTSCPFCDQILTLQNQRFENNYDPDASKTPNDGTDPPTFNFPILESLSHSDDWFLRLKVHLPATRQGWIELISIGAALIGIVSLMLMFTPIPTDVSWQIKKVMNNSPVSAVIESNRYVLQGQSLRLKGVAKDPDGDELRFEWSCSSGARIDNSGPEVELHTENVASQTVPVEITVHLIVKDPFGETASRQEKIAVVPRMMVRNPPVLTVPPRCNCTNLELIAGESVSFYALAEDQDRNDHLTYSWHSSSPSAQIINTNFSPGSTAILDTSGMNPRYTAVPVKVTLRVSDGNGGEVVGDLTIMILPKQLPPAPNTVQPAAPPPNHSPKLEAFTADKTSLEQGESVRLWAFVTDPDGDSPLYYDWRASGGEIQNKNETAILTISGMTAPEIIVILTISDGRGGRTSQKMFLTVTPPASKTPTPSISPAATTTQDKQSGLMPSTTLSDEGGLVQKR